MEANQKFRIVLVWELPTIVMMPPSAIRSAIERLLAKSKIPGRVTVMEVVDGYESVKKVITVGKEDGKDIEGSDQVQRKAIGGSSDKIITRRKVR